MTLPFRLKWGDLLIAGGALALAVTLLLWPIADTPAGYATVSIDGEQVAELSLDKPGSYVFDVGYGANTVEVVNGGVRISDADCPDGYCVKQGTITLAGQTLICLPHRLAVELRSSDESGDLSSALDAVAS